MPLEKSTTEKLKKFVETNYDVLPTDQQETRLSLEECRKLIGEDATSMTNEQVEAFRDAVYTIVDNVLDYYFDSGNVCR